MNTTQSLGRWGWPALSLAAGLSLGAGLGRWWRKLPEKVVEKVVTQTMPLAQASQQSRQEAERKFAVLNDRPLTAAELAALSVQDLELAYRYFRYWSPGTDNELANWGAVCLELARREPAALLGLWKDHPPNTLPEAVRAEVWKIFAGLPDEALAALLNGQPPLLKAWMLPQLLTDMARTDPRRALSLIPPEPVDRPLLEGSIYSEWSQKDPEAAWTSLFSESHPATRLDKASPVFYAWLKASPEKALEWLGGHFSDLAERPGFLRALLDEPDPVALSGDFSAHYDRLRQAIEGNEDIRLRTLGQTVLARLMQKTDPNAAWAYAETIGNPGKRRSAQQILLTAEARTNPQAAVTRAVEEAVSPKMRQEAGRVAATAAVAQNPVAALTWAQAIREPLTREATFQAMGSEWVAKAPAEAVAEAVKLSDPEDRWAMWQGMAHKFGEGASLPSRDELKAVRQSLSALPEAERKRMAGQLPPLSRIALGL